MTSDLAMLGLLCPQEGKEMHVPKHLLSPVALSMKTLALKTLPNG